MTHFLLVLCSIIYVTFADPNACNLVEFGGNQMQWHPTDVCGNWNDYYNDGSIGSEIYECSKDKSYVTYMRYSNLNCRGHVTETQIWNVNNSRLNCDGIDCSLIVREYNDCDNIDGYQDIMYVTSMCEQDMNEQSLSHYNYFICNDTSFTQWNFQNHSNYNCDGMTNQNAIITNNGCDETTKTYFDVKTCNCQNCNYP